MCEIQKMLKITLKKDEKKPHKTPISDTVYIEAHLK